MVHVDLVEDALPPGLAQPCLELGPQKIDLAVEHPPAVRDLELFLREIVDQLLEIGVRERGEIGEWFHGGPFVAGAGAPSLRSNPQKGQPQLEAPASAPSACMISSTSPRNSASSSIEACSVFPSA
jgi:hypothetical protein